MSNTSDWILNPLLSNNDENLLGALYAINTSTHYTKKQIIQYLRNHNFNGDHVTF